MTTRPEVPAELLQRTGLSPVLVLIREICARWKIVELELFGSVLRAGRLWKTTPPGATWTL